MLRALVVMTDQVSSEYMRGYGDGYRAAVKDAQIELRKALGFLDGARLVTIHGYDDE